MSSQDSEVLLTLAAATAILDAGPVMTRGGRALSVRGTVSIHDLTAGDGPFTFGILEKGISLALLDEYFKNEGPVTPDSVSKQEIASRGAKIRTLGVLQPMGDGTTCSLFLDDRSLKGLKFSEENAGWSYWLLNNGRALTTGAAWRSTLQTFVEFNPSG